MRSNRILVTAAMLTLAVTALRPGLAAGQDSGIGLPLGTAPEAPVIEDLDGNAVDLAQWVGKKPVLIEFWATWCPVCKALEPRLEQAFAQYGDRVEFLIVGVGVSQTPRQIRRHLEDHELPGRFLFDRRGAAARAFAAPTTSYIVVLDASGKVLYTGSGEEQPIGEALRKATQGNQTSAHQPLQTPFVKRFL
ncbi:MAG: TlpA family protein disulfide reductase [Longimicrobiales bacterium]